MFWRSSLHWEEVVVMVVVVQKVIAYPSHLENCFWLILAPLSGAQTGWQRLSSAHSFHHSHACHRCMRCIMHGNRSGKVPAWHARTVPAVSVREFLSTCIPAPLQLNLYTMAPIVSFTPKAPFPATRPREERLWVFNNSAGRP